LPLTGLVELRLSSEARLTVTSDVFLFVGTDMPADIVITVNYQSLNQSINQYAP